MALGSTQPLTEMSTRSLLGGKGGRCVGLTTLPPSCAVVMKSGNLSFLGYIGQTTAFRNGFYIRYQMERIWRDSYSVGLQGKAWERLHLGAQHRRISFISCPSGDGNRTLFRKLWFFVPQTQGNSLKSILKHNIIPLISDIKLVLVSFEYIEYNRTK
jgi:hypothetical protein